MNSDTIDKMINGISYILSPSKTNKKETILQSPDSSPDNSNAKMTITQDKRDLEYSDSKLAMNSNNIYKFQNGDGDKLIGLLHSSRCRKGDSCKFLGSQCLVMQRNYVHAKKCKDKNCKDSNCSRAVLRHFAECQDICCYDCNRVRSVCLESSNSPRKSRGIISMVKT